MERGVTLSLGYKGQGTANGLPAYTPNGVYTLGGTQATADTQIAYFGRLVSSNPSGDDGIVYMGIPSGYLVRGILLYDGGVAQNDPAKPDSVIVGAPLTVAYKGQIWNSAWLTTAQGASAPYFGSVVIANNTTGELEFLPIGSAVPTGWTKISASVKTVDTVSGALIDIDL